MLGLPGDAYAVRSGRRPEYGLQIYTRGSVPSGKFSIPQAGGEPLTGDIKSVGGYVMAAGSVHPSGETYQAVTDGPVPAMPPSLTRFRTKAPAASLGDAPITSGRNSTLTSIAGKLRGAGLDAQTLRENLHAINERRCEPPLPDSEVERIADNAERWPVGESEGVAVRLSPGKGHPENDAATAADASDGAQGEPNPGDWRGLFHTLADFDGAPEPSFLIDKFLQEQSITGLIGPARARKSIITVNILRALLTGEPLFGKLPVTHKPDRCLYLCPESGLLSTAKRLRNMGLRSFVADGTLLFTSMNNARVELMDPRIVEACRGAVVFIDTAVRFFKGDENSAADMSVFADHCQRIIQAGARAIVLLHHTKKGAEGLTLEGGRGSGDFGGFLTCCWGTTLSDYEDAFNAQSLMSCVKQRDFQAESFKLAPSGNQDDFFLEYVEGSENSRVQVGAKEKAGKAKAVALARANPGMTADALRQALAGQGITYSESSCRAILRAVRSPVVSEPVPPRQRQATTSV